MELFFEQQVMEMRGNPAGVKSATVAALYNCSLVHRLHVYAETVGEMRQRCEETRLEELFMVACQRYHVTACLEAATISSTIISSHGHRQTDSGAGG